MKQTIILTAGGFEHEHTGDLSKTLSQLLEEKINAFLIEEDVEILQTKIRMDYEFAPPEYSDSYGYDKTEYGVLKAFVLYDTSLPNRSHIKIFYEEFCEDVLEESNSFLENSNGEVIEMNVRVADLTGVTVKYLK